MGMRDFYEKITEVQDEIRIFEQSLSSRVSEEDIVHKLLSLCSNVEIPINIVNWQSGTKFYRARILNRYVRRFIPKERKIETVSIKELDQINHWINARPMKILNWQSPRKVFQQFAVFG